MNLALFQGILFALTLIVVFFLGKGAPARKVILGALFSFLAHAAVVLTLIFPLHTYWVYSLPSLTARFSLKYLAYYLAVFLVLCLVYLALNGSLKLVRTNTRFRWYDVLIGLGGMIFLGGAAAVFFVSRWFIDYFGSLTGNQLLFLLGNGQGESTADVANQISHYMVIPTVIFVILGLSIAFLRSDLVVRRGESSLTIRALWLRLCALVVTLILLVTSIFHAFAILPLSEVIDSRTQTSTYAQDNYVEPTREKLHFPATKRNLIHIYMESVENSYYDKAHGGYEDRNLMPELMALNEEGVHFSNTQTFGGPHQTSGSEHSIAAMINMWAGIPGGSDPYNFTYPQFTTLGDILHSEGYQTSFMLGADADWGGLRQYYLDHGNFTITDHKVAKERGLIPQDYQQNWGFEDDKLYEFAKDELTRLNCTGEPFYFVLENADTHFPDGYVSPRMTDKPYAEQYANVIHYSQKEVVKFVNWLKQQPFYANTTVVITGDHQSMDKNFFAGWDPNYERTVVNMILNSAEPAPGSDRTTNRDFAPFDMFPTILYSMGVGIDGNRLGMGTNLFSSEKTLVERDGLEKVNLELRRDSDFFVNHTPAYGK